MAHGQNAGNGGHPGREYWSRRYGTPVPWGKVGKKLTHRKERARAAQLVSAIKRDK